MAIDMTEFEEKMPRYRSRNAAVLRMLFFIYRASKLLARITMKIQRWARPRMMARAPWLVCPRCDGLPHRYQKQRLLVPMEGGGYACNKCYEIDHRTKYGRR